MMDVQISNASERIVISVAMAVHDVAHRSEGWANSEVAVNLGPWSGRYAAQFHGTDFSSFATESKQLISTLDGVAGMSSLDGYLNLTLTGDGLGHVAVAGSAWDRPGWGSHLEISFEIDQTYLPDLLASVEEVIERLGPIESP
jgi:hypothetical protein